MWVVLHWALCVTVCLLFGLFLVANWGILIGIIVTRPTNSVSMIAPFVSGPICALTLYLSPSEWLQSVWWVPIPLDVGILFLPWILFGLIYQGVTGKRLQVTRKGGGE